MLLLSSVGASILSCAMVERDLPRTMSDANIVSVINTIDQGELDTAYIVQPQRASYPWKPPPFSRSVRRGEFVEFVGFADWQVPCGLGLCWWPFPLRGEVGTAHRTNYLCGEQAAFTF